MSNCLFIECVDFKTLEAIGNLDWPNELEKKRKEAISVWSDQGDVVTERQSEQILAFTQGCAPLSIFPFSSMTCMDLMVGIKSYRSYLNVSAIGREFEHRGWRVLKTPKDLQSEGRLNEGLFEFEKGGCRLRMPLANILRMQMETGRAQTVIQECDTIRRAGTIGVPGTLHSFVYDNEYEMWD